MQNATFRTLAGRALWCLVICAAGCFEQQDDEAEVEPDAAVETDGAIEIDANDPPDAERPDAARPDAERPPAECPPEEPADACGECGGDGPATWYYDEDGDGAGDDDVAVEACDAPDGFVGQGGDPDPGCATDDTDVCGVCGGPGASTWFADVDGDGLGDPAVPVEACEAPDGFVDVAGDLEPLCATNDTDACGICAGPGPGAWYADVDGDGAGDDAVRVEACAAPEGFVEVGGDPEPLCATDDTDECGVCAGQNRDKDCIGVCFGEAGIDGCGVCVGGTTGREPALVDSDRDFIPDQCDHCPDAALTRTIIQWTRVAQADGNGGPYTFQIELFENGDFAYRYGDVEPWGASPTIGHQQLNGEQAVTLDDGGQLARDAGGFMFRRDDDGRVSLENAVQPIFVDIRHAGESVAGEFDERDALPVDLGFEFPFGDAVYDTATVHADGVLTFGGNDPGGVNSPLPRPDLGPLLAPMWDDFDLNRQGSVQIHRMAPGCDFDCAGMVGGVAFVDECGVCAGGTTGRVPDATRDCHGTCGGDAFIDACGECVGGETGREPRGADDCRQAPDLIVDREYLAETTVIDFMDVRDECLLEERCVGGVGRRKLLRFGTRIANVGNVDLRLGRPEEGNPLWDWGECHGHFHFDAYATYDLVDVETGEVLPIGAKAGFSVIDIGVWDPEIAVDGCRGYNSRNQGITAGCQDTYGRHLQCQWIDVTDVEDGLYELVVTTNPDARFAELSFENNSARVRVRLTGDQVEVLGSERNCADEIDDDGDGDVDCDDADCEEVCALPPREPPNACPAEDIGQVVGEGIARGEEQPVQDALTGNCAGAGAGEYAMTWTAPADDTYLFHTFGSTFDTSVYVRDGGCDGAVLACGEDTDALPGDDGLVEVELREGQQVTVAVDGMLRDEGSWQLSINGRQTGCPDANLFSEVGAGVLRGDTAEAPTRRIASCAGGAAAHHTYAWTAPQAGRYTFDTFGSAYDTALFILPADCSEEIACNDDRNGLQSFIELELEEGESIVIGLGGYRGNRGGFVLNINRLVEAAACPAEDLGGRTGEQLAVVRADDLADELQLSCGADDGAEIGFTWAAPADGRYLFHSLGSGADTTVEVRAGVCDGEVLGCSADVDGVRNDTPWSDQGAVELDLAAGESVVVLLEAVEAEGDARLAIHERTDGCPAADLAGAVGAAIAEGGNAGAPTRLLTGCVPSAAQRTYGWTAPAAGTWVFDTDGSDYDTTLAVLDGTCGAELACDDDGGESNRSRLEVELAEGQTVTLVVGGFRGRTGQFVINANPVEPAP